jgi:hypothetical protein
MGYTVGQPAMNLDRLQHNPSKDKHAGNIDKILEESFPDEETGQRNCHTDGFNPELSKFNYYFAVEDGEVVESSAIFSNQLIDDYKQMADAYRVVDKNGKSKKLRDDAKLACAGVCKPEESFMSSLSEEEQEKFFKDSARVLTKIYQFHGIQLDCFVVHVDEPVPHMHYAGHDSHYKLSHKAKLPLYNDLNTAYPKAMQRLGWDVKELTGYKEETKGMDDDELEDYKFRKRKERKLHGLSANDYKALKEAQKDAEQARKDAERIKADNRERDERAAKERLARRSELDRREKAIEAREDDINRRDKASKARSMAISAKERNIETREAVLSSKEADVASKEATFNERLDSAVSSHKAELNKVFHEKLTEYEKHVDDKYKNKYNEDVRRIRQSHNTVNSQANSYHRGMPTGYDFS